MKNKLTLTCLVIFLLTIFVLCWNFEKNINSKDLILPPPNKEFDQWRKQWEKQRLTSAKMMDVETF